MKATVKILHLVWAVFWSVLLLWISFRDLRDDFGTEPHLIAIPLLCVAWLPFAAGLLFGRAWGWFGSFAFTVLSLFVALYLAWMSVAFVVADGWRGRTWLEFAAFIPAVLILALLLHTRGEFLGGGPESVEPVAPPNGGPAGPLGNSGAAEGPPSVS